MSGVLSTPLPSRDLSRHGQTWSCWPPASPARCNSQLAGHPESIGDASEDDEHEDRSDDHAGNSIGRASAREPRTRGFLETEDERLRRMH